MALTDIVFTPGDWAATVTEVPAQALTNLVDIVSEPASNSGASVSEIPGGAAGGGILRHPGMCGGLVA